MRMTADALFSKIVFNCSSGMLLSFILRHVCLPKLSSVLCRIPKANLHLGKLEIFSYGILYTPLLKNEILRTSIILAAYLDKPSKYIPYRFQYGQATGNGKFCKISWQKKMMLNFFLCVYYWPIQLYIHVHHAGLWTLLCCTVNYLQFPQTWNWFLTAL